MNTWAPLWNGFVDSSIWEEPDHVFRVFVAMMSLKDADHIVRFDGYKLARRIHMDHEMPKVLDALRIMSSPDSRRPGQEFEGRRIKAVPEGWLVLNGEKYRAMVQIEMRKSRNRRAQAAFRERQKNMELAGERAAVAAERNGDQAHADRIAESTLPDAAKLPSLAAPG